MGELIEKTRHKNFLSLEEYLTKESESEEKHEFHEGEIHAMAGASHAHNLIFVNLISALNTCLRKKGVCRVYPSDMLLRIPGRKVFFYPDLSIVCGSPEIEKHRGMDALLNPSVVIEILSKTTRERDTRYKSDQYLSLKSLKQYVMVESTFPRLRVLTRDKDDTWRFTFTGEDDNESVHIHDCQLPLKEIYRDVVFDRKP